MPRTFCDCGDEYAGDCGHDYAVSMKVFKATLSVNEACNSNPYYLLVYVPRASKIAHCTQRSFPTKYFRADISNIITNMSFSDSNKRIYPNTDKNTWDGIPLGTKSSGSSMVAKTSGSPKQELPKFDRHIVGDVTVGYERISDTWPNTNENTWDDITTGSKTSGSSAAATFCESSQRGMPKSNNIAADNKATGTNISQRSQTATPAQGRNTIRAYPAGRAPEGMAAIRCVMRPKRKNVAREFDKAGETASTSDNTKAAQEDDLPTFHL